MPVFAQESLVGYPLLLWQYTSAALFPHPLQLLPWPYAWSFLKGFHCSLISLVPGNSDPSVPKAELRGNVLLKKKSRYFNSFGPKLDEAWERHVPLNCFDKAIWASGEHFKDEGPWTLNWQQFALLQWAHLFSVSHLLREPLGFTALPTLSSWFMRSN